MMTFAFTAANGVPFVAVFLQHGELSPIGTGYRIGDYSNSTEPVVEFYDARYPHREIAEGVTGQFTGARYYVTTILGTDGYGSAEGGIRLSGDSQAWTIDADSMTTVRGWLAQQIAQVA